MLPLVELLELGIDYKLLEEVIRIFYDEAMFVSELKKEDKVSGLLPGR
jgi:hypothetical protein